MPRLSPAVALFLCALLPAQNDRPPEAFQIGLGLQQRGLHEEAARAFQQFLQGAKGSPFASEAWYRLGVSQTELGQPKEAIASLKRAMAATDLSYGVECRYRLANLYREQQQLAPARDLFAELGGALPADHYLRAAVRYGEGECERDLGNDTAALAAFRAAAAAAKGDQQGYLFPAQYQAGFALLRLQQFGEAAKLFADAGKAAADDAARAECCYLGGDASLRAKDLDQAESSFRSCLQLGGEFADDAVFGTAFCQLERGKAEEALASFRRVVKEHGDSPLVGRCHLEIGRLLYRGRQFAAARQELALVLGDGAAVAELRQGAQELDGLCALELGAGGDALQQLRAALSKAKDADKPRLHFALGEALSADGKWSEALAYYQQVDRGAGEALYGDALYGACFCLHQLQQYEASRKLATQLRRELPQHRLVVQATFALAENLFAERQYEAAEKEYAAVPKAHELAGKALFKAAWCVYLRGDKQAAAARFAAIAQQDKAEGRQEAQAMSALSWLEAGLGDKALAAADGYRARYPKGEWLARTERVAARVLRERNDLSGAAARLAVAQRAAGQGGAGLQDQLEQAELCYQQGDFQGAQKLYAPLANQQDALGARALEGLAWCAFELGDDDGCGKLLARGMAHPQVGDLRANLLELRSALHHRQAQWDAAAQDAAEFLRDFQKHEKAPAMRYARGLALARGQHYREARVVLAALAKDGGYERMDRVHYELAWACRRDGDEKAALAAFAEVAKTSQDKELMGEARLHLGVAKLDGKDEAAARQLLQQVDGSSRAQALYRLGFMDLDAAEKEPARLKLAQQSFAQIAAMGEQEPLAAEATFLRGECERRGGDRAAAAASFRALLRQAPLHPRAVAARLLLGECDVELGVGDEAVQQLEQYLQAPPEEGAELARAQLLLGRARQLRAEHERAEVCFQKVTALSDGPAAAEAQYRIGETRLARQDLQGAADAFVKLPILYAQAPWVQKGLLQAGLTYEALKQPQKARRFYEELVRRFPEAPETQQATQRLRGV